MWDVYTQSKSNRLPKFWQKAFEAAYEHLVSDIPGVRDSAVSEIAKMSIRTITLDPLPAQSQVIIYINWSLLLDSIVFA